MSTTSGAINSSKKRRIQRTCGLLLWPRRFQDRRDNSGGAGSRYFRVDHEPEKMKISI